MSTDSQEQQIWELLESNGKAWTPAPELARIALQYCRAIAALRKRYGRDAIQNRIETVDGVNHGFYRLKPKTERFTAQLCPAPAPTPAQQSFDASAVAAQLDKLDECSRYERARQRGQEGQR